MEKFTEIIELLLQKKAVLDSEMELDIEVVVKEIRAQYAERSEKIEAMLTLAGYEAPAVVEPAEIDEVEATEEIDETVDEAVATEAASGKTFYSI